MSGDGDVAEVAGAGEVPVVLKSVVERQTTIPMYSMPRRPPRLYRVRRAHFSLSQLCTVWPYRAFLKQFRGQLIWADHEIASKKLDIVILYSWAQHSQHSQRCSSTQQV